MRILRVRLHLCREIFEGLSTADRENGPKEHATWKMYSSPMAVSRMPPFTHRGGAVFFGEKFARSRAFAMLRQSLRQFWDQRMPLHDDGQDGGGPGRRPS